MMVKKILNLFLLISFSFLILSCNAVKTDFSFPSGDTLIVKKAGDHYLIKIPVKYKYKEFKWNYEVIASRIDTLPHPFPIPRDSAKFIIVRDTAL
jgi:hypothetical protein